jgi:hypothetical protein
MVSSTSHVSSSPAISKSLMVMVPVGLDCEMRLSCMSWGHSRRQTCGVMECVPGSQTPPTPVFDASTYDMYRGFPGFNSRTDVGRLEMCWSKVAQSRSACLIFGVIMMCVLSPWRALKRGEQRPLPAGSPSAAWFSLPTACWKLFSLTFCSFAIRLICCCIFFDFAAGSCIVYSFPLNSHPRISLMKSHFPSCCVIFFSEIGSAPLCCDTDGGGKIEWIPCSIARDACWRWAVVLILVHPMKSST